MLDNLRRVRQNTSYNCGPAVLEMLLSHFGREISQEAIVAAAGMETRIKDYGMTVEDMARALRMIAPEMALWYKTDSKIGELREIVRSLNYPTGINWQGVFPDDEYDDYPDFDFADDDEGHFSVVVDVDTRENYIQIADPYGRFAGNDRHFPIVEFERRWWDEDWELDPVNQKRKYIYKSKPMFVVVPETIGFPMGMGMRRL